VCVCTTTATSQHVRQGQFVAKQPLPLLLLLVLLLLQRRMVDGNMFIDAKGPFKSMQDLWDDNQ
jgi:hypothetical protein